MLEKSEGTIKNGQSRETLATIGTQDTGRRQTKQKKKKNNTTQKTKQMSNTDPTKNQE